MTSIKTLLQKWDNQKIFDIIKEQSLFELDIDKHHSDEVKSYNIACLLLLDKRLDIKLK